MSYRRVVRSNVDEDIRRDDYRWHDRRERREVNGYSRYDEYYERMRKESYYQGLRDAREALLADEAYAYARDRDQFDQGRRNDYYGSRRDPREHRYDDDYYMTTRHTQDRYADDSRYYRSRARSPSPRRYQLNDHQPRGTLPYRRPYPTRPYRPHHRPAHYNDRRRYTDLDIPNDKSFEDESKSSTEDATRTALDSIEVVKQQDEAVAVSPKFSDDGDYDHVNDEVNEAKNRHDLPKRCSSHNSPESRPESLEYDILSEDGTKGECGVCGHHYPIGQLTLRNGVGMLCLQCDLPSGWAMKMSTRHNRPYFFQVHDQGNSKAKSIPQWEHPTNGNVLNSEFD